MADEIERTRITKRDVEAVADKLQTFLGTLPEQERDVLGWILTRAEAAPANDDTSGYFQTLAGTQFSQVATPLATQLGKSAGFGNSSSPGMDVSVPWKFGGGMNFGGQFAQR